MANIKTLDNLLPEEIGKVVKIDVDEEMKSRLLDLGIIENTSIKCVGISPLGDPKAYLVRGTIFALRKADSAGITVEITQETEKTRDIILIGNPNVGKSTIFNALTGMKQHTGNWTGKTVASASGKFETELYHYRIIDLPGTYSLNARSPEEEVTLEYITENSYFAVVVVCDATNLEHSMFLALQILSMTNKVIICLNLIDEATRKGIKIDTQLLQSTLNVPVVAISAQNKNEIKVLKNRLDDFKYSDITVPSEISPEADNLKRIEIAEEIAQKCIINKGKIRTFSKIDKILTSKKLGYLIMLLLLTFLFWITIYGANYPSAIISDFLFALGDKIENAFFAMGINETCISIIIDGIYNMVARVISVMLPPMAIFFPLFTILEDLGYLPRVAFNLDKPFNSCKTCGKQALTMCMGFGCNACGVTGTRIIDSKRERLLAMITNSFVPCNGKFPTIIALISMFLLVQSNSIISGITSAIILTMVILLGIALSFISTKLLSLTVLKGKPTSFVLELPPFRKPQVAKVLLRSVFDRTLLILSRAIVAAAPAGLIVWLAANITINSMSILSYITNFLDPFASIFGLDGVILTSFILGIAANETVIPIMIMSYLSTGALIEFESLVEFKNLLIANGWTMSTAICTLIFTLLHWPCATTLISIKKESGKIKWVLISAFLPTIFGLILCFVISTISKAL